MEHGKTYCTTCGAEMVDNASFCGHCGAGKGTGHKFCGNCGAAVTAEQEFCTTCGQKLGAAHTPGKGTDAVHKVTDTVVEKATNLADLASKKTGKKIKPSWLAGGVIGIVVLAVVIFMLIPKGLSGDYQHRSTILGTTTTDTMRFKGKEVTEVGTGNTGTYKISGDTLEMKLGDTNMTAKLSSDKKSFTIQSASGLSGLAAGLKYTKVGN